MKKLMIAVAMMLASPAFAADPMIGTWKTQVDDGAYAHVDIAPCGGVKVCGVIAHTFNDQGEYKSPNIGKMLVIDMVPNGDNSYEGSVWRPSNNKIYIGKIELAGDTLYMRGCIAGGLLCSKQIWKRLK